MIVCCNTTIRSRKTGEENKPKFTITNEMRKYALNIYSKYVWYNYTYIYNSTSLFDTNHAWTSYMPRTISNNFHLEY